MTIKKVVKWWFFAGVILVFVQILIGGITRLTGSGLSITEWEIIRGTLPPINRVQWLEVFELYKSTPQYEKINAGMSLGEFKAIYFWEYFHRLWARMMGFVFVVPLIFFFLRGWIPKKLIPNLLLIFFGAFLVAFFGWVMVASGLKDRPWVNAYNLSIHLVLALGLYCYILWNFFLAHYVNTELGSFIKGKRSLMNLLLCLVSLQIILGAWMSGMHAALLYPTWPDMNGEVIPDVLLQAKNWHWRNLVDYDGLISFTPSLVQLLHRTLAYIIVGIIVYTYIKFRKLWENKVLSRCWSLILLVLGLQVVLGISTLLLSIGSIPVVLGSLHQVVAIILLSLILFLVFASRTSRN